MGLLPATLAKSHLSDEPYLYDEGAEMGPLRLFLSFSSWFKARTETLGLFTWPGLGVGPGQLSAALVLGGLL